MRKAREEEEREVRQKNYLVSVQKRAKKLRRETFNRLQSLQLRDEEKKKQDELSFQIKLIEKVNYRRIEHDRLMSRSKSAGRSVHSFDDGYLMPETDARNQRLSLAHSEAQLSPSNLGKVEQILSSKGYAPVDVAKKPSNPHSHHVAVTAPADVEETYFELDDRETDEDDDIDIGDVKDSLEFQPMTKHREAMEYSKRMLQQQRAHIEIPGQSGTSGNDLNSSFADSEISGLSDGDGEPEKLASNSAGIAASATVKKVGVVTNKEGGKNNKKAVPIWKKLEPIPVAPFVSANSAAVGNNGRL